MCARSDLNFVFDLSSCLLQPTTHEFRPDRVPVYCTCEMPYNPGTVLCHVHCWRCELSDRQLHLFVSEQREIDAPFGAVQTSSW